MVFPQTASVSQCYLVFVFTRSYRLLGDHAENELSCVQELAETKSGITFILQPNRNKPQHGNRYTTVVYTMVHRHLPGFFLRGEILFCL